MNGDYLKLDPNYNGTKFRGDNLQDNVSLKVGEAINDNVMASEWLDRRAARLESIVTDLIW